MYLLFEIGLICVIVTHYIIIFLEIMVSLFYCNVLVSETDIKW